jgi:hypothetical protein
MKERKNILLKTVKDKACPRLHCNMLKLDIGARQRREPGARGMPRGVVDELLTRNCRLHDLHNPAISSMTMRQQLWMLWSDLV